MKIVCNRETLREGLTVVGGVIPAKGTKPVLENVCLVAADDRLELVGTDLEVSVRYRVEGVEVVEPGPAVLPARVLLDFVRDLSGEQVRIETEEATCKVTSEEDGCDLVAVDPDEFPVVGRFRAEKTLSMQGGNFVRLVQQTAFAAAKEPGRYAMHGVMALVQGDRLRMVATDGRRMAMSSVAIDSRGLTPAPSLVPTKGMQLFCRVISDPLDQIELTIEDTQIGMRTAKAEVFARLIDGDFPDYEQVIPQEVSHRMEADRELLTKKLRLVANLSGDESRAVRMNMSKNRLELYGRAAGRGEAKAHLEVDFKGDSGEIAFNPDFVIEGLKHCTRDSVTLEFNLRTTPGRFDLGEDFVYVVMPITVGS